MPRLHVRFSRTRFPAAVLSKAIETIWGGYPKSPYSTLSVRNGAREWSYDNWGEFVVALSGRYDDANVHLQADQRSLMVYVGEGPYTTVTVTARSADEVARAMAVFEETAAQYRLPEPEPEPTPPLRVFIGHGGASTAWQDLKTHLQDVHHFDVIAYETGSRAGHTIRDVLEKMLAESSFALIVMTPEDGQADGTMRARQNVVHEAGLFQGRLGFPRTIIVLQEGVERFSNIDGVQYSPFKSSIREVYGDVVAALYEASRGAR